MTQITWFARLVTAEGAAAANIGVQLQLFDMKGGWTGIGDATTNADGRIKAVSEAPGGASGPAPMMRLMETDAAPAMLGGVPAVSVSSSPPALACDFGEIVHIPDRITFMRASPIRMNLRPTLAAGVAMPAAEVRGGVADALGGASAKAETTELQTRLAARELDVSKLQVERDSVVSEAAARASEARQAQTERDEARTLLSNRTLDLQKAQSENAAVKADLDTRATAIKAVQSERDDAKTQLAVRVLDLQKAQAENATVKQQLSLSANALKAVQAERDDARTQLTTRETDVEKLRLERDQVKVQLADSEKRLSDIRTAGTATAAAGADADPSFGTFATRLGGEIDSAQNALKNRGFSLGKISVIAPGLQRDAKAPVEMVGAETLKTVSPELLTKISIDYHPSPEADAAGTGVAVPNIGQLTESAARRVLVSVGLGLEVTQGPPSLDPTCAEGQVMLQSPKAGENAPRGTRVIAIFSRKEGPLKEGQGN